MSKALSRKRLQEIANAKLQSENLIEVTYTVRWLSSRDLEGAAGQLERHMGEFMPNARVEGYVHATIRDLPPKGEYKATKREKLSAREQYRQQRVDEINSMKFEPIEALTPEESAGRLGD